jgi:hypothetical protein
MRSSIALIFLSLSACAALAGNDDLAGTCRPSGCVPPRDGICEHPKIVVEEGSPRYESDPTSRSYEKKCIARSKSFAMRRGGELRLSFGNRTTRTYKDNLSKKACEQGGPYESCRQYMLYDFFPEHDLFLIHIGYYEGQEWRLVRQLNGKEETLVDPPRYSPNRKWLAAVEWNEGDDANNGIDIVSAQSNRAEPSFHYRPKEYELWQFVRWDGDDRLVLSVQWRPEGKPDLVTWSAEVVRVNGQWQLNRQPPPVAPPRQ